MQTDLIMDRHIFCFLFLFIMILPVLSHDHPGEIQKDTACGETKGCYSDCENQMCSYMVTWLNKDSTVLIGVHATLTSSQNYVTLGLSKDQKMGDDSTTSCIRNTATGNIDVFMGHNPGYYNQKLSNATLGLQGTPSSSFSNNILSCEFERVKTVNDPTVFNLDTDSSYYIFLAKGAGTSGGVGKHNELPIVSTKMANFLSLEDFGGTTENGLVKAHGCCMVGAWILLASIGIVLARFYKPVWPSQKLLGKDVWFTLHRSIMVLAVAAVIVGFVIIFVDVEGWSSLAGNPDFQRAHPYLGVIIMALALMNPIMALFRPHPGEKNRVIFNWAHWAVGTGAHVLAVLNIFIGVSLPASKTPQYLLYILGAYAIYQFLLEVVLEIFDFVSRSSSKKRSENYELQEKNANSESKDEKTFTFKRLALGIHVLVVTAFSAVIIYFIASA